MMVAIAVMLLRKRDPGRKRAFKVPALIIIGPLTIAGCLFLFLNLPAMAMLVLPIWSVVGFLIYFGYSRGKSHLGHGVVVVPEAEIDDIPPHIPGIDDPRH